jgi:hypothetical protein
MRGSTGLGCAQLSISTEDDIGTQRHGPATCVVLGSNLERLLRTLAAYCTAGAPGWDGPGGEDMAVGVGGEGVATPPKYPAPRLL